MNSRKRVGGFFLVQHLWNKALFSHVTLVSVLVLVLPPPPPPPLATQASAWSCSGFLPCPCCFFIAITFQSEAHLRLFDHDPGGSFVVRFAKIESNMSETEGQSRVKSVLARAK